MNGARGTPLKGPQPPNQHIISLNVWQMLIAFFLGAFLLFV